MMNMNWTSPKITGSNGATHDLNQVAREVPRSSRARNRVPTTFNSAACPAPSNDRQLRPTKLRVLRKRCEVIKTPLELPAQVTTNNAPSGSAKSFVLENVLDYYQPPASHVWDCNLQKKWKRVVFGGDLRHAEKGNSGKRSTDAIPDLSSEFTAGSVVWAKLSGLIWWPAMVDFDERGLYADYDPVTHKATHYWVVSLEPHVMTAKRIPALCLRDYVPGTLIDETLKKSKHWSRIEKAIEAAEDALKLPIHTRIKGYGYNYSEKTQNIPKKSSLSKQRKNETRRFSTRIRNQKGNNSKKVPPRHQGARKSYQKAIVGDVSIPLVEQAVLKRPRKIPSAHQVGRAFLPQGVPPNSGGRSTIQEPLQCETFFDFPNCFLKCIPTTSTQKTSSENSNSHFAHTSGSPKMIFYEQFLKNNFPGCTRSREGRNSGSYESAAEESIKSRTFCKHDSCFNKELISTTSLRGILSKDLNGHKRSNSMVNFIKGAIKSKLEGRASMIRQLSVIITNLPFHLQLKPVECHTHAFK